MQLPQENEKMAQGSILPVGNIIDTLLQRTYQTGSLEGIWCTALPHAMLPVDRRVVCKQNVCQLLYMTCVLKHV